MSRNDYIDRLIQAAEELLVTVDHVAWTQNTSAMDDAADSLREAIDALCNAGHLGCRVTLDNKLICCNPDAVAAHDKEHSDGNN